MITTRLIIGGDSTPPGPYLRHLIEAFECQAIAVVPMATLAQLHGVVIVLAARRHATAARDPDPVVWAVPRGC